MEKYVIKERTIEETWRTAMWHCVRHGSGYRVERGSYVGQLRHQLPYALVIVQEPWVRPLAPRMPEGTGFPPPTDEDSIGQYFARYIMSEESSEGQEYTYGESIAPNIDFLVEILNSSSGNTNQAAINIGGAGTVELENPPCLRIISFKVVEGKLQLSVFFRSWDLFAGMPENLGGLQLLKEYVLENLHFSVSDGPIIAFSDGLHVYEQYFPLVNVLCVDKLNIEEA